MVLSQGEIPVSGSGQNKLTSFRKHSSGNKSGAGYTATNSGDENAACERDITLHQLGYRAELPEIGIR